MRRAATAGRRSAAVTGRPVRARAASSASATSALSLSAATSSTAAVRGGSSVNRRVNASSSRAVSGSHGPARTAASPESRSAAGSSISASGLPAASASSRVRTAAGRSPAASRSVAAASRGQRLDGQVRQRRPVEPGRQAVPDRGEQRDRLRLEPPAEEREHLAGGRVKPVRVLGQQQHRGGLGHLREQVQGGQGDHVDLGGGRLGQAERGPQRLPLAGRQRAEALPHRPQQLVQPRVGQVHLRFHADRVQHAHAGVAGEPGGLGAQRGLADAGLAAQDQRSAPARARVRDERVETGSLRGTSDQLHTAKANARGVCGCRQLPAAPDDGHLTDAAASPGALSVGVVAGPATSNRTAHHD